MLSHLSFTFRRLRIKTERKKYLAKKKERKKEMEMCKKKKRRGSRGEREEFNFEAYTL